MSDIVIRLKSVSKLYKLYRSKKAKILDLLGLSWLSDYEEFWALKDINLEIKRGERIGIIGPNGAGKSTLLKIISGNISPTEGEIYVTGTIQPLLEIGTGFHPEFTGRENIRASLAYMGFSHDQIKEKEEDIIDFAELEDFIDQPVKTYSSGMYSRLAFSVATAIEPDILIVDEILGVGDAYFASKSLERMKRLTEQSMTTVLFVSHDFISVERLCERCIWIERGKVIMEGETLDVTRAYSRNVKLREEQRLRAKNLKISLGAYKKIALEGYADSFILRFTAFKDTDDFILHKVSLFQDKEKTHELVLGDAQDTNPSHSCWVLVDKTSKWTKPVKIAQGLWGRALEANSKSDIQGLVIIALYAYDKTCSYEIELHYIPPKKGSVCLEVYDGESYKQIGILTSSANRKMHRFRVNMPILNQNIQTNIKNAKVSKWPGSGEIVINNVILTDSSGREKAIFSVGEDLRLRVSFSSKGSGVYNIIFSAVLYRMDGVRVSCHVSKKIKVYLKEGETNVAELVLNNLNLGNGNYVFSVGLFRDIDPDLISKSYVYDQVDRSYEFQVTGRSPLDGSIFNHPYDWYLKRNTKHKEKIPKMIH